jgi:hypothetical protein
MTKLFSYSVALIVSLLMWMYIVEGVKAGIKLYQHQTISNPNGSGG